MPTAEYVLTVEHVRYVNAARKLTFYRWLKIDPLTP